MGTIIRLAAANSSAADKQKADVVCAGHNDERVFNEQISKLTRGGTLQLLDGDYYFDAFDGEGRSAVCFGYNDGQARVINIVGDTENKSYNTAFGVSIHVTSAALDTLNPGETGHVFYATDKRPTGEGQYYDWTFVNNVNFDNFYLFFARADRAVIGIDAINMGATYVHQVGIYTASYFSDRYNHLKPPTPAKGFIGIRSTRGANDELARIGFHTIEIGGLWCGIQLWGMEHVIMQTVCTGRCCYGYQFGHSAKTLTLINCDDEGNTHLPKFYGQGQITCLDFNIERFPGSPVPDDPDGDTEPFMTEDMPGGWRGRFEYTVDGDKPGKHSLWKDGHGFNMKTVNLQHNLTERPDVPELYETYFDKETNKTLTWNGKDWVDAMGNEVRGC